MLLLLNNRLIYPTMRRGSCPVQLLFGGLLLPYCDNTLSLFLVQAAVHLSPRSWWLVIFGTCRALPVFRVDFANNYSFYALPSARGCCLE